MKRFLATVCATLWVLPSALYAQGLGASQLILTNSSGGGVILQPNPAATSVITYTLPADLTPTSTVGVGILQTNASGNLSWLSPTALAALVEATAWALTGNAIIGTEFLGTTNAQPLVIRTNNTERMRITAAGDVVVQNQASGTPTTVLQVLGGNGGAGATQVVIQAGASQSGVDLLRWQNNGGDPLGSIRPDGSVVLVYDPPARQAFFAVANPSGVPLIGIGPNPSGWGVGVYEPIAPYGDLRAGMGKVGTEWWMGVGDLGAQNGVLLNWATTTTLNEPRIVVANGSLANPVFLVDREGDVTVRGTTVALPNIPNNSAATEVLVWSGGNVQRRSAEGLAWLLTGNSGTDPAVNFLGTTDAQPLVIQVNSTQTFQFNTNLSLQRDAGGDPRGQQAVDLQSARSVATQVASGDYSVIGGGQNNTASGLWATVGGGYLNTASGNSATVGGGYLNTASGYAATVGGGESNTASGFYATVGGGRENTASGAYTTVGGGYRNTASGNVATVGGGQNNTASGFTATVGGGYLNDASGDAATVGGGWSNTASGDLATVGGGIVNTASGSYATVGGGQNNTADGILATVGGGQNNTASGDVATVGGGKGNTASGDVATVGGGHSNTAGGDYATVGGGLENTAGGDYATVGGGRENTASVDYATVGGGYRNTASGDAATVGGGYRNTASGYAATVGGGSGNTASGYAATVGGGESNTASGDRATVGGGYQNTASGNVATVGGGLENTASGYAATVGGGESNTASGFYATVGGGYLNDASVDLATVGGGRENTASGYAATVGGGESNTASGDRATVGGGSGNTASGYAATVGGGEGNTASGDRATVGGGEGNTASGFAATVGGGWQNIASSFAATVGGGQQNTARGDAATVGGGKGNTAIDYGATVSGGALNTASGDYATVGGGLENTASGDRATVGGGQNNTADGILATVGGGYQNTASGFAATVGGGYLNDASGDLATVGGGYQNTASGFAATVGGGYLNDASGDLATVGGGWENTASGNVATVGGGLENTASGFAATVGGGWENTASGNVATVGGGLENTASGFAATVGGGWSNTASVDLATVGGGYRNTASGLYATVGGGQENTASGALATVGGGIVNTASGFFATVGGGVSNTASGDLATVGGGQDNTASGSAATVGGGSGNTASGDYSAIPGGFYLRVGERSFGFSGQTSAIQTDLSANSNIAAFVDVDLWLYSRDRTQASQLRFYEAQAHTSGPEYVAFQAPNTLTTSTTYTLPADLTAGPLVANARILQSDDDGNLSWLDPAELAAATAWALTGNSGTNPAVNFLGTTDAQPLVIRTNNTERMRVTAGGNVGIGTTNPQARLHVEDGEIWLFNDGNNPRFVIGDDPTTGQYGWLQWDSNLDFFRIDHSSAPGDGLKLNGNFVSIGNLPVDQPLKVGLGTTEYMRVTTTGNVGIGTTTPAATLDVNGTVAFSATATLTNTGSALTLPSNVAVVEIADGAGAADINVNPPTTGTQGQVLFIRYSGTQNLTLVGVLPGGGNQTATAQFHAILMYIGGGWRLMSFVD